MKRNVHPGSLILLFLFLSALACKKSIDQTSPNSGDLIPKDTTLASPQVPYPLNSTAECNYAPDYGDSIVFPQPASGGDFFVYPQNNQGMNGKYFSWPGGLEIDPASGAIDLTRSETGQRYSVAFVKNGTNDTCMSQLIVAGAAYMDSVYVLSQSQKTAKPYFNANPYGPPVCDGNQGQGCTFDYNNAAHNQGIEIDQKTGFIDLEKTMKKSPFGLLPINGTTVYTTINYKLNDNSNQAAQKIQLKMVYYRNKSDVPVASLLTVTDNLLNILGNLLVSKGPSARPPLIIIVRNN